VVSLIGIDPSIVDGEALLSPMTQEQLLTLLTVVVDGALILDTKTCDCTRAIAKALLDKPHSSRLGACRILIEEVLKSKKRYTLRELDLEAAEADIAVRICNAIANAPKSIQPDVVLTIDPGCKILQGLESSGIQVERLDNFSVTTAPKMLKNTRHVELRRLNETDCDDLLRRLFRFSRRLVLMDRYLLGNHLNQQYECIDFLCTRWRDSYSLSNWNENQLTIITCPKNSQTMLDPATKIEAENAQNQILVPLRKKFGIRFRVKVYSAEKDTAHARALEANRKVYQVDPSFNFVRNGEICKDVYLTRTSHSTADIIDRICKGTLLIEKTVP
jgi:hypothetical protein